MAKIRKVKGSPYWYVDYYDNDGKRIRKSIKTYSKKVAEAYLIEFLNQRAKGKIGILRNITFKDYKDIYLDFIRQEMRPKTLKIYSGILKFFEEYLSKETNCVYLQDISREILNNYKHYRARTLVANSVNIDLRTLKSFFNEAIKRNLLKDNPMKGVALMECVEEPTKKLSIEEYQRIFTEAKIRYKNPKQDSFVALLYAYVYTGARSEELLNLTQEQIDLKNGVMHIYSHNDFKTKTGKMRVVSLHPLVIGELKKLKKDSEFVFYSEKGVRYKRQFWAKFKRIVRDLGLGWVKVKHLRSSLASHLSQRGVSPEIVAKILGHKNISTTLKYYLHATNKDISNAINLLPDFEKVNSQKLCPNFAQK